MADVQGHAQRGHLVEGLLEALDPLGEILEAQHDPVLARAVGYFAQEAIFRSMRWGRPTWHRSRMNGCLGYTQLGR